MTDQRDDLWQYFGVRQETPKRPSTIEYEQRKCAHPGCEQHPSFGYGPPFCEKQAWTCGEHQVWFEETQGKPRVGQPADEPDAWIEGVMEQVRRDYAEKVQPQVRAYAENRRVKAQQIG